MKFIFFKFTTIFSINLFLAASAFAQTERDKGIELYKQGKNKEAISVLEKASKKIKTDAEVWNYLGLAQTKNEAYKKAIKAFEKAVAADARNATYQTNLAYVYFLNNKLDKAQSAATKAVELDAQNATAYYVRGVASVWEGDSENAVKDADRAISLNADYAQAYNLKADALLAAFGRRVSEGARPGDYVSLLEQAQQTVEICLKKCQNNQIIEAQETRLDALQAFGRYFSKNKDMSLLSQTVNAAALPTLPVPTDANNAPLKITKKPLASYTNSARQNNVRGTVRLAVLFSESGRVTHTLLLKGLDRGLTENALTAARKIEFEPAKKDGKPVSQVRIVEYSFDIH